MLKVAVRLFLLTRPCSILAFLSLVVSLRGVWLAQVPWNKILLQWVLLLYKHYISTDIPKKLDSASFWVASNSHNPVENGISWIQTMKILISELALFMLQRSLRAVYFERGLFPVNTRGCVKVRCFTGKDSSWRKNLEDNLNLPESGCLTFMPHFQYQSASKFTEICITYSRNILSDWFFTVDCHRPSFFWDWDAPLAFF